MRPVLTCTIFTSTEVIFYFNYQADIQKYLIHLVILKEEQMRPENAV